MSDARFWTLPTDWVGGWRKGDRVVLLRRPVGFEAGLDVGQTGMVVGAERRVHDAVVVLLVWFDATDFRLWVEAPDVGKLPS